MSRKILLIAAILIIPAGIYLGLKYWPSGYVKATQQIVAHSQGILEAIWGKIDKILSTASLFAGTILAFREMHKTRKRKREKK